MYYHNVSRNCICKGTLLEMKESVLWCLACLFIKVCSTVEPFFCIITFHAWWSRTDNSRFHLGKLTALDLANNSISAKGAFHVAEYIKKSKSLLWISLYMNDIGDEVDVKFIIPELSKLLLHPVLHLFEHALPIWRSMHLLPWINMHWPLPLLILFLGSWKNGRGFEAESLGYKCWFSK